MVSWNEAGKPMLPWTPEPRDVLGMPCEKSEFDVGAFLDEPTVFFLAKALRAARFLFNDLFKDPFAELALNEGLADHRCGRSDDTERSGQCFGPGEFCVDLRRHEIICEGLGIKSELSADFDNSRFIDDRQAPFKPRAKCVRPIWRGENCAGSPNRGGAQARQVVDLNREGGPGSCHQHPVDGDAMGAKGIRKHRRGHGPSLARAVKASAKICCPGRVDGGLDTDQNRVGTTHRSSGEPTIARMARDRLKGHSVATNTGDKVGRGEGDRRDAAGDDQPKKSSPARRHRVVGLGGLSGPRAGSDRNRHGRNLTGNTGPPRPHGTRPPPMKAA